MIEVLNYISLLRINLYFGFYSSSRMTHSVFTRDVWFTEVVSLRGRKGGCRHGDRSSRHSLTLTPFTWRRVKCGHRVSPTICRFIVVCAKYNLIPPPPLHSSMDDLPFPGSYNVITVTCRPWLRSEHDLGGSGNRSAIIQTGHETKNRWNIQVL